MCFEDFFGVIAEANQSFDCGEIAVVCISQEHFFMVLSVLFGDNQSLLVIQLENTIPNNRLQHH